MFEVKHDTQNEQSRAELSDTVRAKTPHYAIVPDKPQPLGYKTLSSGMRLQVSANGEQLGSPSCANYDEVVDTAVRRM